MDCRKSIQAFHEYVYAHTQAIGLFVLNAKGGLPSQKAELAQKTDVHTEAQF